MSLRSRFHSLSSSISSSTSTSSPGDLESARIELRASLGRLKLVLLLEVTLAERPDMEVPGRPLLEIDVRRDEGPEVSAPVGETDIVGEFGWSISVGDRENPKSRFGMSKRTSSEWARKSMKCLRTSFNGVSLCIISNIRCLGFRDLHQAVFLDFGQGNILLVPLQTAENEEIQDQGTL